MDEMEPWLATTETRATADVVVIGGGIVGADLIQQCDAIATGPL